jgi:hypothetical protein
MCFIPARRAPRTLGVVDEKNKAGGEDRSVVRTERIFQDVPLRTSIVRFRLSTSGDCHSAFRTKDANLMSEYQKHHL